MSKLKPNFIDKLICYFNGHKPSILLSMNTGKRHCVRCGGES